MRLKSIAVRNYRVHRELVVPLDPALNLIGGPNEAGKSTLLEAARFALFLKAKGGGETQKSMLSALGQGHPEVEVEFEIAGQGYRIAKRFSGANGSATLTQTGGATWQGDEAEEKLGALLGAEVISGRNAGEKAEAQWAHLLVSQGKAGTHPVDYANAQRDSLFARLQSLGGAAVMQSDADASVAGRFRDLVDEWFTKNGPPKVGSDLGRAIEAEKQAREASLQAVTALRKVEDAVRGHQEAEAFLATAVPGLEQVRAELNGVTQRLVQVHDLQQREQVLAQEAQRAVDDHETLQKGETAIEKLRLAVQQIKEALAPRGQALAGLRERIEETTRLLQERETDRQKTELEVRASRLKMEAARAQVAWFEKSAHLAQLRNRMEQVKALAVELKEADQALVRLPHLDPNRLKTLRKLETDLLQAESALGAMATGVEVLASDLGIELGGASLAVGETRVVAADTDLQIGPGVRLRIHPGGGSSLVEARHRAERARAALQGLLDESGLDSVQAAAEALTQRQAKEGDIQRIKGELTGLGAEKIAKDLAAAEHDVAGLQAELERRQAASAGVPSATDLEGAREIAAAAEQQSREAENQETTSRGVLDAATKSAREAAALFERQQQALQAEKDQLTSREAELNLLLTMHGDDAARAAKLVAALSTRRDAEARLEETRRQVATLQPELLTRDQERLGRTVEKQTIAINEANTLREANRLILRTEGSLDPHEAVAMAEARLAEARRVLENAQRRGQAIQLLHKLFQEEQGRLTDQFTLPLAEKVSGYLQCLFGPETVARVHLGADNQFAGLDIVRPDQQSGAFAFEVLSGGAKEQVAAALRLAMAEVLAAGQPDKCLPLVFDDAFAYSDPTRVRTLQRMLDLASQRGLQIIVLTCNPADYATLGAREFRLPEPAKGLRVSVAPNESTST